MTLNKNENVGVNLNKLEIFVDAKTFNDAVNRVYVKEVKKIRIPGFRLGKAPRKIIEKMYGNDVFFQDAINLIYRKALDDAIKESGLDVVSVENFNVLYADVEKGFCFTVDCILKPEVKIENYKGIKVNVNKRKVTEKDVEERIKLLKERVAKISTVEEKRAAKKGDVVVIDFMGFVNGISFKGGTAKNYNLKLGSNQFIKGFEEQVIGHKAGEEFDVKVNFPEDYHAENLKGEEATFKCKLNEIREVILPKEDDDFAKDVSEFNSLKELKQNIKEEFEKANEEIKDREIKDKLLFELSKKVSGEIPEVMFKNKYEELLNEFKSNINRQGINFQRYLNDIDKDEFESSLMQRAQTRVKTDLALEEIVKIEKLDVSEKEIEEELENFSKQYKIKYENIKNIFPVEFLKADLLNKKALQLVKDGAEIIESEEKVKEKKDEYKVSKKQNTKEQSVNKVNAKKLSSKSKKDGTSSKKTTKKTVKKK